MLTPSGVGMVEDGEWADMEDTVDTADTVDTVDTVDGVDTAIDMDGVDMDDTADGTAVNSTTATWRIFNQPLSCKAITIKPFDVLFLHKFEK
jgi:hypothetical protein